MNKYAGFYELKYINLPSVPWEIYTEDAVLDDKYLWTLRVAVEGSNDLNLPRVVGATSMEAKKAGAKLISEFSNHGMVIYYPYFIAVKSGVLEVRNEKIIIEAVKDDLWNLVTDGKKDISLILEGSKKECIGDCNFLSDDEIKGLLRNVNIIKKEYRDILNEGNSIFAEWSYAYNTDSLKRLQGNKYLVFYELRSV